MKKEEWKKLFGRSATGFISLALAILFYFLISRAGEIKGAVSTMLGILTPFIYGGAMAYLLRIPCCFFERNYEKCLPKKQKKHATGLAVFTVLAVSVLVIYLLLSMVLPEIASSVAAVTAALPETVEQFSNWLSKTLEGDQVLQGYINTVTNSFVGKLEAWAKQDLLPMLQNMMAGVSTTVSSIVIMVSNLFIGVVVCIYLLSGRKKFARHGKAFLYGTMKPQWADKIVNEIRFVDKTFVGFFGGKILASAIVGLICYGFCLIMSFALGFPNAMLVSVIIGITNMIPYFGPFIGAIPSALLILMSSPANCIIFLIFIIILQQIDGNIIGPRLLAESVGLSGFWVLFSITVFGGLFGFIGILIGVPIFAVIYDMIKRCIIKGLKNHGRMDILEGEEEHEAV